MTLIKNYIKKFKLPKEQISIHRFFKLAGILTQKVWSGLHKRFPNKYESYIAASYIKFVEGSGARVVPIW